MASPALLRSGVAALSTLAANDLRVVFRGLETPDQAKQAANDVLPMLIETYGSAAATLAADWYDDDRLDKEIRGRFAAIPADVGPSGAEELAGWGVSPLYQETPDWDAALQLLTGGMQRRIANGSRNTIKISSIEDPRATGWSRIGSGECDFCAMLIGRGAVYSEASADFASHDHCNCGAVPAFEGLPRPVKPYTPSARGSAADRALAREWIASH